MSIWLLQIAAICNTRSESCERMLTKLCSNHRARF